MNVDTGMNLFLGCVKLKEIGFVLTNAYVFNHRCKCGNCPIENLVGVREYRCCKELGVLAKLSFEGLEIKCIREHEDYDPLTHRAVLINVGPLLRGNRREKI